MARAFARLGNLAGIALPWIAGLFLLGWALTFLGFVSGILAQLG